MDVGIETVDLEHQTLVVLYNDLVRAVQRQTSPETVISFLTTLQNNLFSHFANEERLLKVLRCRHFDEHVEHHRLAEQAFFSMTFNTDDHLHLEAVAHFMHDWIAQHILVEDRQAFAELPGASTAAEPAGQQAGPSA